jgi:hypothetical protein
MHATCDNTPDPKAFASMILCIAPLQLLPSAVTRERPGVGGWWCWPTGSPGCVVLRCGDVPLPEPALQRLLLPAQDGRRQQQLADAPHGSGGAEHPLVGGLRQGASSSGSALLLAAAGSAGRRPMRGFGAGRPAVRAPAHSPTRSPRRRPGHLPSAAPRWCRPPAACRPTCAGERGACLSTAGAYTSRASRAASSAALDGAHLSRCTLMIPPLCIMNPLAAAMAWGDATIVRVTW